MSTPPYQRLHHHLQTFAHLSDDDLRLADALWQTRTIAKRDFFNVRTSVCRQVGFILKGIFRVYYVDPQSDEEHNLYFIAENTFLTSLKSLLTQTACPYSIEALEDAELLVISYHDLQQLYARSHGWERFGRLLAEQYLTLVQTKSESMLTRTAEERYLELITSHPTLINRVSLGQVASYLGIKGPSLSRIRAQLASRSST